MAFHIFSPRFQITGLLTRLKLVEGISRSAQEMKIFASHLDLLSVTTRDDGHAQAEMSIPDEHDKLWGDIHFFG